MNLHFYHRRPMLLVLALTGAIGAGTALAQQYPSTAPGSPSTAASPSSSSPSTGAMKGTDSMATPKAGTPARTDSASAAWQKLGSKGYVAKDDVTSLSGFSFDTADANHDGRLSQDEFNKAWSTYSGASHSSSTMRGSGSPSSTSSTPSSSGTAPGGATPK
jgi:hypothetical protein